MAFDPVERDLNEYLSELDEDEQARADEIAADKESDDYEMQRDYEDHQAEQECDRLF